MPGLRLQEEEFENREATEKRMNVFLKHLKVVGHTVGDTGQGHVRTGQVIGHSTPVVELDGSERPY